MNWRQNSLNGTIGHDYGRRTFMGPCLDPYWKWCFSVPKDYYTQYLSPIDWKFSTLEDNWRFGEISKVGYFQN
jgi:hypothetical protein